MTSLEQIINVFETKYVDISPLPNGLVQLWAELAIADYEREVESLDYNSELKCFRKEVPLKIISIIADIVRVYYLERELDRQNKKINIIGKDLSLNDTGNAKKMTLEELKYARAKVELRLDQAKQPAYGGDCNG